jgi:hypothetical protein
LLAKQKVVDSNLIVRSPFSPYQSVIFEVFISSETMPFYAFLTPKCQKSAKSLNQFWLLQADKDKPVLFDIKT